MDIRKIIREEIENQQDLNEGFANWVGIGLLALSSLFTGEANAQEVDMDSVNKVAMAINKGYIDRDTIVKNYGDRVDTTFINTYFDKDGDVKKQVEVRKITNPKWSQTSTTTKKDYRGKDYIDQNVFGKQKTKFDRKYPDGQTRKAVEKVKLDKDYDPSTFDMNKVSVKSRGNLGK